MIEETNNKQLSEKYVYYRTIPVLNDWITLKKYIPETYYNFFKEDGHHYDYDEFVSKIPSYIETDTAYVVSGSPVQTVAKTRAINIKRVANKASKVVNTAESTVSFASHK